MQHYRIQHLTLALDDAAGLLQELADHVFRMFPWSAARSGRANARGLELTLRVCQVPRLSRAEADLPLVWSGSIEGIPATVHRRGTRRRIELPGRAATVFDLASGRALLELRDRDDIVAKRFLLMRIVCEGLAHGGHCFLHAACLAMPRAEDWQGVVVCAPSNTGKTTTSLALTQHGWRLLGDDITYVRPPQFGTAVWGFPRACHVRPGSLRLLPWLRDCRLGPPDEEGVRSLALDQLDGRGWVDAPWLTPALVVVLAPPNDRGTVVESIDRVEALAHLASESIDAIPGVCDEIAGEEFMNLGQLACSVPGCRLSVGRDLGEIGPALEHFLTTTEESRPRANGVAAGQAA